MNDDFLCEFYDDVVESHAENSKLISAIDFFQRFNGGVSVIEDGGLLSKYVAAYAHKHFAKLDYVLESGALDFIEDKRIIVDYGCGQGLGTLSILKAAFERFGERYFDGLRIILIEPSRMALDRAHAHIRIFCERYGIRNFPEIQSHQAYLAGGLRAQTTDLPAVHVFSNILDVPDVDLGVLVQEMEGTTGVYVCVSPYIDAARNAWSETFAGELSGGAFIRLSTKIDNVRYYNIYSNDYDRTYVSFHGGYFLR